MEAEISKNQPMRPALIEIVDSTNVTELAIDRLNLQVSNINDEIGEGFSSELTIAQSLSATNSQVAHFTQEFDDLPDIRGFVNRFRFGRSDYVEIAASSSSSGSITFNTAFPETADICVNLCCIGGDEILTNIECKLISATYSGFSYSMINTDEDAHTVALGFTAIQIN